MANPIAKTKQFLTEVQAELKKSAWPKRQELIDSVIVVAVSVVILSIFVSIFDVVFANLMDAILHRKGW
jgi:preprotein translocase subunit SecE